MTASQDVAWQFLCTICCWNSCKGEAEFIVHSEICHYALVLGNSHTKKRLGLIKAEQVFFCTGWGRSLMPSLFQPHSLKGTLFLAYCGVMNGYYHAHALRQSREPCVWTEITLGPWLTNVPAQHQWSYNANVPFPWGGLHCCSTHSISIAATVLESWIGFGPLNVQEGAQMYFHLQALVVPWPSRVSF